LGDIRDKKAVMDLCKGADCVWHNAAAVGPFHPVALYDEVNYHGTVNVIDACRFHKVPKIVMSSSPSTRFTGVDVDGLREDELPSLPLDSYLQEVIRDWNRIFFFFDTVVLLLLALCFSFLFVFLIVFVCVVVVVFVVVVVVDSR
jgi:nucleoside-diphosphate-sugar epimerase